MESDSLTGVREKQGEAQTAFDQEGEDTCRQWREVDREESITRQHLIVNQCGPMIGMCCSNSVEQRQALPPPLPTHTSRKIESDDALRVGAEGEVATHAKPHVQGCDHHHGHQEDALEAAAQVLADRAFQGENKPRPLIAVDSHA